MDVLRIISEDRLQQWTFFVVLGQGLLNLFGVGLLVGLCFWRRKTSKWEQTFVPQVQESLTLVACGIAGADVHTFNKHNSSEKIKIKGLLIPMISSLQGEGKERLCSLYRELGFNAEDSKELKHKNYAIRLGAIARLETISEAAAIDQVRPLLRDESPYVHFAAVRFMLKFASDYHPKIHAEMHLVSLMNRYDAAREILDCYSKRYLDQFIHLFETTPDEKVRSVCLEIIQKNRLVDALPAVLDKLIEALRSEGHDEYARFDFKKMSQCLTISPSDEIEEVLTRMTLVEDPKIRVCGYRALFKVRPDLKFIMVNELAEDQNPSLKRLYAEIREELAQLERVG